MTTVHESLFFSQSFFGFMTRVDEDGYPIEDDFYNEDDDEMDDDGEYEDDDYDDLEEDEQE